MAQQQREGGSRGTAARSMGGRKLRRERSYLGTLSDTPTELPTTLGSRGSVATLIAPQRSPPQPPPHTRQPTLQFSPALQAHRASRSKLIVPPAPSS
eukprot:3596538-Pleurochrysis_carterae.AAC.1